MGRTCVSRSETFYLERDKYRLRCLCLKKKKTAETCRCVCLYAERTSLCLFFARLYRMYVCVVGRAGKQALGWEGGRTPSTQIIDTILAERNASRSKKSGWWSSALQSDPLHPTWSGEKRTEARLPGTQLYLFVQLYPCLLIFFFFFFCFRVTIGFRRHL